ncbi:hypothetical protein [Anaerosolibacter carboniphilus]|nr:hypothetical protein [Anaerosolibacter carboniphilus]
MSQSEFSHLIERSKNGAVILSETEQILAQIELHIAFYPYSFDYYPIAEVLRQRVKKHAAI